MRESVWRIILALIILLPIGSQSDSNLLSSIFVLLCLTVGAYSLAVNRHYLATTILLPPLLLFCLYLLLQLIPLPPDLLKLLSPATGRAYQETVWIVQEGVWMPLAVHAELTIRALLFVAAVGCLCLAICQFIAEQGHFARILQHVTLAVAAWSVSAVVLSILPLVSPAHFMTWQESMLATREHLNLWSVCFSPLLLAGYAIHRPRVTRLPFIQRIRGFHWSSADSYHIIEFLTITLVVINLLISRNGQGALLLFFAWMVFKSFMLPGTEPVKTMQRWALRGIAAISLAGFYLLNDHLFTIPRESPGGSLISSPNSSAWLHTWFGCGLGGHGDLFTPAEPSFCNINTTTYLGSLFDLWIGLGAWGALLLISTVLILLRYACRGRWGRPKSMSHKLIAGGMTSLLLLFIAGFYGSNLNWEAIFSGGCVVLLLMLSPRLCREAISSGHVDKPYHRIITSCLFVLVIVGLIFSLQFYVGIYTVKNIGDQVAAMHSGNLSQDQLLRLNKEISRTLQWFPSAEQSSLLMSQGYLEYYQMNETKTLALFERALLNRPLNPQLLMALVGTYGWIGKTDTAEKLMSSEQLNNYRPDQFLERLLTRLFTEEITETGLKIVQKIFDLCPEYTAKCLNLLYVNGWSHDDIQDFLPSKPSVWFAFGDMLYAQGEVKKAEETYLKAVAMRSSDYRVDQPPYNHVVNYFVESGQLVKALIVADAGVENYPKSGLMRRIVADVHSKLGNAEKAKQGYDQADILDREAM